MAEVAAVVAAAPEQTAVAEAASYWSLVECMELDYAVHSAKKKE